MKLDLFLELTTLIFFALVIWHAAEQKGRYGLIFISSLFGLGFVRENFVTFERLLYGYADLHLALGAAPLIGSIIWPYSVYIACAWAEAVSGERLEATAILGEAPRPWPREIFFLGSVGVFMIALVGFYEPLLDRVGMARWEEGTRKSFGSPWIAVIGYPSLAIAATMLINALIRRFSSWRLGAALLVAMGSLALVHAWGLQMLKDALDW